MKLNEKRKKILEKTKVFLEKKEEIIFAYVFGSFITEEKYNDIDVAVYIKNEKIDHIDYSISLSVEMEKEIKQPLDIKVINALPLPLKYHITKGILLFTKDEILHENFICDVWKKYIDFKYFSDIYIKELKNA